MVDKIPTNFSEQIDSKFLDNEKVKKNTYLELGTKDGRKYQLLVNKENGLTGWDKFVNKLISIFTKKEFFYGDDINKHISEDRNTKFYLRGFGVTRDGVTAQQSNRVTSLFPKARQWLDAGSTANIKDDDL